MKTFVVDAFTSEPFKGNPAGICIAETALDETKMLQVAQELNHSETAFVTPRDSIGEYAIRFFSPKMEIPLCGHATLSAAKVVMSTTNLRQVYFFNQDQLKLSTTLVADQIAMQFPIYATQPADAPMALLAALGIQNVNNVAYNEETNILLLEISDTSELAALKPDFPALYQSHCSINGVLITAASSNDEFDFHSRYFWPWSGTNEDPVTGGTHTFLAKYWSDRLNKTRMKSYQSSDRTGSMDVEIVNDHLLIIGHAVIVLEGNFFLPEDTERV